MATRTKLRLGRALRSAIYQAARKCVDGGSPLFEIGSRPDTEGAVTVNARLWNEDADLCEMECLATAKYLEMDSQDLCELDLYATTTHRGGRMGTLRELERNVYVLVSPKGVLWATSDERERARLAGEVWE